MKHTIALFLWITAFSIVHSQAGQPSTPIDATSATDYFQKVLPNLYYDNNRYEAGTAYFLLDENGNLVGRKPVGIDEDDIVVIVIAAPMIPPPATAHKYTIEITGDDYNPVDLRITGSLAGIQVPQTALATTKWTHVRFDFGPYTSDKVIFNIKDNGASIATHNTRINDLYNVFVGASFISSNLEDPDFTVVPLSDSTNTIQSINGGSRTIATANITWYWWPSLRRWFTGDNVARGRDILKEPNLLERINPTFGVALSEKVFENFFVGGSFEFARGGCIVLGGHYGGRTRLLDRDFIPGESAFAGQDSDIRTEKLNDWGFFFGVTLDTRLITALRER